MKFQSLAMTLFCAASLVAALPVNPSTGSDAQHCIKPEDVRGPGEVPGKICGDEPHNEKRDDVPTLEECEQALHAYNSEQGDETLEEFLGICEEEYGPPGLQKRQAPKPSVVGGPVGGVVGSLSELVHR